MKAIILASGSGKRLRPLTDKVPKPLIKIGGKTLLDYQLDSLIKNGVENVVITTGPFNTKIEEHVSKHFRIKAQYIHNPRYDTTNNIYSLWLVKDCVDSEILLLHGDLLFDDILIKRLVEAKDNCILVNKEIKPPEKDFKALIENNRVIKIGVEVSGAGSYYCAPMYKFSKADFLRWISEIEAFINRGEVNCYAEDALNTITNEVMLSLLFFNEFCMEIDTPDDLEVANNKITTITRG